MFLSEMIAGNVEQYSSVEIRLYCKYILKIMKKSSEYVKIQVCKTSCVLV